MARGSSACWSRPVAMKKTFAPSTASPPRPAVRAWSGAADLVLSDADRAEIARLLPVGFAFGDRYGPDQAATVERYC